MNWSHVIKTARLRNGLKQEALAAYLGIDQCTVSRWERGATRPTLALRKSVLLKLGRLCHSCATLSDLVWRISKSEKPVLLTDAGSFITKAASLSAIHRLRLPLEKHEGYDWHESPKTVQQANVYGPVTNNLKLFDDRTITKVDSMVALRMPDGMVRWTFSTYIPVWISSDLPRLIITPHSTKPFTGGDGTLTVSRATEEDEILTVRNE